MKIEELPTNEDWLADDWAQCFASTAEYTRGVLHRTAAVPTEPDPIVITPDMVTEVVRFHGTSPEGWSSVECYAVVRLTDGRWASLSAWADTTGWGCQDGVTWHIGESQEQVERWGLDDDGRKALGIDPPSE